MKTYIITLIFKSDNSIENRTYRAENIFEAMKELDNEVSLPYSIMNIFSENDN